MSKIRRSRINIIFFGRAVQVKIKSKSKPNNALGGVKLFFAKIWTLCRLEVIIVQTNSSTAMVHSVLVHIHILVASVTRLYDASMAPYACDSSLRQFRALIKGIALKPIVK